MAITWPEIAGRYGAGGVYETGEGTAGTEKFGKTGEELIRETSAVNPVQFGEAFSGTTLGESAGAMGSWVARAKGIPQASNLVSTVEGAGGMLRSWGEAQPYEGEPFTWEDYASKGQKWPTPGMGGAGWTTGMGMPAMQGGEGGLYVQFSPGDWPLFFNAAEPKNQKYVAMLRLHRGGELLRDLAKRFAPVDLGRLRDSIAVTTVNENTVAVGSPLKYAAAVEFGTRPHYVPLGALTGWAKRHGIPAICVQRAIMARGTRAQPFMRKAWDEGVGMLEDIFSGTWDQILGIGY